MQRPNSDTTDRGRISRIAATAVATAVVGGALALAAPSAGATPASATITAWGKNAARQTDVPTAAQSGVVAIAASTQTGLALKTDGSVVGWGTDSMNLSTIPAAAQSGVVAIDAEGSAALALKSDGSLVGWGEGRSQTPTAPLTGVTEIASSSDAGMALKSDHTIQTWGGSSLTGESNVPAAVQGHAVSIDGGNALSVALTDTGAVAAWGWDGGGGTAVPDAAKSGVVKVVASGNDVAALKSDGSVVTWGASTTAIGPTPAAARSGVVDVAVGFDFAVALKSDGSLVSWGSGNAYGQQNIPAAAGYHATALAANGFFAMTLHAPLASVPPVINGTPPAAVLGQPYDFTVTAATDGGVAQVTEGTLPAGLRMDSSGRITGTPTKAGRATVTVTATTGLGSASWPMTVTVQPQHSTNVQFSSVPPASVDVGALESDQYVRSFAERYNQTLTSNLTVGGTTVPAGTKVNVYYVHDDHVGSDNAAHTLTGSEGFGTKVLATATSTADLQATTALFKAPGTTYPTSTDQGLEFDDSVTKYVDQTGINFTLNSYNASDAARVITLAP
ncbi:MAG TPA: hypothetical protein VGP36_21375 [Mycobacteriales bacterium]|nr:hypothetical protein [Mycobacteriales bacterium]